ncbi:MAG: GbsR/MarR family transcriptional regulator [Candidatus Limnocylindrales bacterium]
MPERYTAAPHRETCYLRGWYRRLVASSTTAPSLPASSAEEIRLAFADAWGQMGEAWGVPPSVARVHGYVLAHAGPLTEREVRQALGLSHRAASLALAECVAWGLVEPLEEPVRVGRRGPSAVAYGKVGDHWTWFQRIAEQRKQRETDPMLPLIAAAMARADEVVQADPRDGEAKRLRDWLTEFHEFVRLFDRAVALVSRTGSTEIARGFGVLARLSDESLDRLLRLFASLPEDELAATIEAISQVSPVTARRVLSAASRVARLGR